MNKTKLDAQNRMYVATIESLAYEPSYEYLIELRSRAFKWIENIESKIDKLDMEEMNDDT